jgi:hypothetical protein
MARETREHEEKMERMRTQQMEALLKIAAANGGSGNKK